MVLKPLLSLVPIYTKQFKLDVLNYMIEHGTSLNETAAIFKIPALQPLLFGEDYLKHKD